MTPLLLLLAALLTAEPKDTSMIVTVRGALLTEGKPVTDANLALRPASAHTVVDVAKSGAFTVKAVASRNYLVSIWADGFAPVEREVELDASGNADLGKVTLDRLVKVKAVAKVAPRGGLKDAAVQEVELTHGACAQIRAQDSSGCLVSFCVQQQGGVANIDRYTSGARTLGKVSLEAALDKLPGGGTFVTGSDSALVGLVKGETIAFQPNDAYCVGLMHVSDVGAR